MRLLGLVVLSVAAATARARAAPANIAIRGDACDLSGLEVELADMLATDAAADSRVSVVTSGSDGALRAEVLFETDGRTHGPRIVTASSCDDLVESIALVIVMAMPDSMAREATDSHAAEPAIERSPSTEPERSGSPAPPVGHPVVGSLRVAPPKEHLSIASSARAGSTTTLSIDGYVGGASRVTRRGSSQQLLLGSRLRRGDASLALQAAVTMPDEVRVSASGHITVTQADVSVAPCVHLRSLAGCALLSVGLLHGSGEKLVAARTAVTPIVSTGVRIGWERALTSGVAVSIHVDGRALLTTSTFEVDHMPVWESSRFEGSAGVGLLARFL